MNTYTFTIARDRFAIGYKAPFEAYGCNISNRI